MDDRSVKEEGAEVDIESGLGLGVTEGNTLFAKISVKGEEDKHSVYLNESNLCGVSIDMVKVENKFLMGKDLVKSVENRPVKEKRKKSSNKKAAKPPRPPKAPSLDAADHKLIREITELAILKRARIERMKVLKKMKAVKSSSSSGSSSSMFALVFTFVFCIVILLQGMSSGKSSVTTFQGSPVSIGGTEDGLISVQYHPNPSSSERHAPASESHKIVVQQVTGSHLPVNLI